MIAAVCSRGGGTFTCREGGVVVLTFTRLKDFVIDRRHDSPLLLVINYLLCIGPLTDFLLLSLPEPEAANALGTNFDLNFPDLLRVVNLDRLLVTWASVGS